MAKLKSGEIKVPSLTPQEYKAAKQNGTLGKVLRQQVQEVLPKKVNS